MDRILRRAWRSHVHGAQPDGMCKRFVVVRRCLGLGTDAIPLVSHVYTLSIRQRAAIFICGLFTAISVQWQCILVGVYAMYVRLWSTSAERRGWGWLGHKQCFFLLCAFPLRPRSRLRVSWGRNHVWRKYT